MEIVASEYEHSTQRLEEQEDQEIGVPQQEIEKITHLMIKS